MNYSRFLNALSKARKPSPLREMTGLLAKASPSVIFLATGLPNPELFPFDAATLSLKDGRSINVSSATMNKALQYGPTPGFPDLVKQLRNLQKRIHNPPNFDNLDLLVTPGSQDGLCKCLEMIVNPGDYVLLAEPTYPGTLGILNPYNPKYLSIEADRDGIIPESLRNIMSRWSPKMIDNADCVIPKLLYVNPNGANPTGTTLSLARRKEIYKIAQEYDLLIIEDDPYYYLQFSDPLPSLLSMDVDGRVVRLDSFSKILSAGMRVGYVTGPKQLLERINFHMQVSILHCSNLSQVFISELLRTWGDGGFDNHVKKVQTFYKHQKEIMVDKANRWLTGLAEWDEPVAGMFLWMKVIGMDDTFSMIMEKALSKEILVVPGRHFAVDASKPSPYLRAAFSLASEENIDKGFQRLAELIKEEIRLKKAPIS